MTTQTLTVSYETTQTIAFASNDSSVTGLSSVAVTVSDGTNYYYYSPSDDTLGNQVDTVASGTYTWQTVYTVDYLQSTGSQYVDTGVIPSSSDTVNLDIDAMFTSPSGFIVGASGSAYVGYSLYLKINALEFTNYYNGGNIEICTLSLNTEFSANLILSNGEITGTVDSTAISTTTATNYNGVAQIYLFRTYAPSTYFASGKIYSCDIKINDDSVREYIPIYYNDGSSSRYALYDKTLKTSGVINNGVGTFTGDSSTAEPLTYPHTPSAPTVTLDAITSPTAINTAITLKATGTPVTSGNTLTFQWAYSTDGTTYTNFGSATTSNPNETTYTPTTSGTYYFRVTVTETGVTQTGSAIGSTTVVKPIVKVWTGSSWVTGTVKVYRNNTWVQATHVKVWNGTAWVESQTGT